MWLIRSHYITTKWARQVDYMHLERAHAHTHTYFQSQCLKFFSWQFTLLPSPLMCATMSTPEDLSMVPAPVRTISSAAECAELLLLSDTVGVLWTNIHAVEEEIVKSCVWHFWFKNFKWLHDAIVQHMFSACFLVPLVSKNASALWLLECFGRSFHRSQSSTVNHQQLLRLWTDVLNLNGTRQVAAPAPIMQLQRFEGAHASLSKSMDHYPNSLHYPSLWQQAFRHTRVAIWNRYKHSCLSASWKLMCYQ